jgi:arginyl-tRNA synthetase
MATLTLEGLTALLQGLDLDEIPAFPSADPLRQPVDIFHAYLAVALQALVGCDVQQAYDSITPANTVGNGDLDIILPKLKLAGDPDLQDLAADLARRVSPSSSIPHDGQS